MSATATERPRTRKVETTITEEQPVQSRWRGIDCPWQEFCAQLKDDPALAAITEISIYRVEPAQLKGFLTKTSEPIDEAWIQRNYGGGVYNIKIYQKPDISHFERNVSVAGEPKVMNAASAQPAASAASTAQHDAVAEMIRAQNALLEKLVDRVMQPPPAPPAPQSSAERDAGLRLVTEGASAAIKLVADSVSAAVRPPEKPAEDPLQKKLMEKLLDRAFDQPAPQMTEDVLLARLEKYKNIFAPANGSGGGMLEQVKMLTEIAGLIEKFRGEGGGAVDWKAALVQQFGDKIPDIVGGVQKIFEARAKEMDARARGVAAVAATRVQQPAAAIPPGAAAPAAARASQPGAPHPAASQVHVVPNPPTAAGSSPNWGGPLAVEQAGNPSAADLDAVAQEQQAAAATAGSEADVIDRYVKNRMVQLVAEGADAMMILDVIDGMSPMIAARLSEASEAEIRQFLAADPILAQITKMAHFEAFLAQFLQVLHDEGAEEETPARPN